MWWSALDPGGPRNWGSIDPPCDTRTGRLRASKPGHQCGAYLVVNLPRWWSASGSRRTGRGFSRAEIPRQRVREWTSAVSAGVLAGGAPSADGSWSTSMGATTGYGHSTRRQSVVQATGNFCRATARTDPMVDRVGGATTLPRGGVPRLPARSRGGPATRRRTLSTAGLARHRRRLR